jgi:tRNA modification GTPase
MGVEVARRQLGRADVVLLCVEAGVEPGEEERSFVETLGELPVVHVRTKADASPGGKAKADRLRTRCAGSVRVSVVTGEGLDELRSLLPRLVYAGLVGLKADAPVLTRRRHARALGSAREAVGAFAAALAQGVPAEMAATHLREAETSLEELLGVVSVEDVLDAVFAEFCIGK